MKFTARGFLFQTRRGCGQLLYVLARALDFVLWIHQSHRIQVLIESGQDASHVYLETCTGLGQRLGDIKPAALHPFRHWSGKFQGWFVIQTSAS
ncbi:MAG: hypothetical protein ABIT37_06575 [Luteolibacter sp.]